MIAQPEPPVVSSVHRQVIYQLADFHASRTGVQPGGDLLCAAAVESGAQWLHFPLQLDFSPAEGGAPQQDQAEQVVAL
jgi:hypothetical protein